MKLPSRGAINLTLITDPPLASFGSWLEQLVAESSGKDGKGIVPVDLEPPADPDAYGSDRLVRLFPQRLDSTTGQLPVSSRLVSPR